jgi:hypothetical protein
MLSREVCETCKEFWPVFKKDRYWVCVCDYRDNAIYENEFIVDIHRRENGGDVPDYCPKKFEHAIAAGRR